MGGLSWQDSPGLITGKVPASFGSASSPLLATAVMTTATPGPGMLSLLGAKFQTVRDMSMVSFDLPDPVGRSSHTPLVVVWF